MDDELSIYQVPWTSCIVMSSSNANVMVKKKCDCICKRKELWYILFRIHTASIWNFMCSPSNRLYLFLQYTVKVYNSVLVYSSQKIQRHIHWSMFNFWNNFSVHLSICIPFSTKKLMKFIIYWNITSQKIKIFWLVLQPEILW